MKRQILFWTLSLVLCIIAGGTLAWNTYVPNGEFRVSQKEAQSYLDEHLPQTDTWVEITDASLEFKKNILRTAVSLHTDEFAGHAYSVLVFAEGRPRYKPSEGSFYLDVTSVTIEAELLAEEALTQERNLCAIPLSFSRARNTDDLKTGVLRKAEEFMRALMQRMVVSALQRMPVYELPANAEGAATAVFLEEVLVADGEVIFSFTFWRALWLVLLASFCLVSSIAVLTAMVRNPTAILALAFVCVFGT